MALANQDRVLEKSTTTGTGTYTLGGSPAITGFSASDYDTFASVGNANTCIYTAVGVDPATGIPNNTGWEVGLGTYTASGTTLARTTIYRSTNANAAVSWSAGTRFIFCSPVTEGTVVVRQPGGTVGTDEIQVSHNGTLGLVESKDGSLRLNSASGTIDFDYFGTVNFSYSGGTGLQLVDTASLAALLTRNSGFSVSNSLQSSSMTLPSTFEFKWANNGNGYVAFGSTYDIGFKRVAAGVVGFTDGSSGTGWLQNSAGVAILDANFTSTSTTMANTNLTCTVISGRSYAFRLLLPIDNATAGDGFKCDFDGSTATMTRFLACAKSVGTITEGVVTSAALATDFTFTSVTSTAFVIIEGSFKASGNGTFKLRAAKNSDAAGATMTLLAGARMELNDMVAV